MLKLALDVMGTDMGPGEIIGGGIQAAEFLAGRAGIVLVGRKDVIERELSEYRSVPDNIEIHHAAEEVRMTDSPADVVRRTDTSIAEGVRLHRDGKVQAFISPGNTGAVMGTAVLQLGRLRHVKRPAIASFFPAIDKRTVVVLDVGANAKCKPLNLYQFAIMGEIVSGNVCAHTNPRVGLLSIGEERSKGNDLIVESHRLLAHDTEINFVGNVEGRDILMGKADVVVTDGFVGNVVLKFAESIEGFLTTSIRRQISKNLFSRAGAFLMAPFLRRLRNSFDYSEVGGAPLMGVNGVVIICHGSSSSKAIRQAISVACEMIDRNINEKIEAALERSQAAVSAALNGNGANGG